MNFGRARLGLNHDRKAILANFKVIAVHQCRILLFQTIDAAMHARTIVELITTIRETNFDFACVVIGGFRANNKRLLTSNRQATALNST